MLEVTVNHINGTGDKTYKGKYITFREGTITVYPADMIFYKDHEKPICINLLSSSIFMVKEIKE